MCGDDGDDLSDLKVDVDDHGDGGGPLSDRLTKAVLPGLPLPHPSGGSSSQQSSCMNATGNASSKPRIWSIADVATSGNSPPGRGGSLGGSPLTTSGSHHLHGGGPPGSHLGSGHKMSGGADTDSYRPSINGFRPWVNGTSGGAGLGSGYPGSHHPSLSPHGQTTGGGPLSASLTSGPTAHNPLQPSPVPGSGLSSGISSGLSTGLSGLTSGLLRPYALTPRTEVH